MTHGCITLVTADEDIMTSTLHVSDVNVGAVKIFAASSALLIIERLIVLSATDPLKYWTESMKTFLVAIWPYVHWYIDSLNGLYWINVRQYHEVR